jgi:hypothetical protein
MAPSHVVRTEKPGHLPLSPVSSMYQETEQRLEHTEDACSQQKQFSAEAVCCRFLHLCWPCHGDMRADGLSTSQSCWAPWPPVHGGWSRLAPSAGSPPASTRVSTPLEPASIQKMLSLGTENGSFPILSFFHLFAGILLLQVRPHVHLRIQSLEDRQDTQVAIPLA